MFIVYAGITERFQVMAARVRIGFACWGTFLTVINVLLLLLACVGVIAGSIAEKHKEVEEIKATLRKNTSISVINAIITIIFGGFCLVFGYWWLFALELICIIIFITRMSIAYAEVPKE